MKKYILLVSLLCLTSLLGVSLKAFALPTSFTVSAYGQINYPESPPARGNIFSVSIWTGASDYYLQKTAELGVGWVRIGNAGNWRLIEWGSKGNYIWRDEEIEWAQANGIEPYIWVGYTPEWATSIEPYDMKNPPDDMDDYKDFVYEIVKRYDLKVVGLWNEPRGFFSGTEDQYVALIQAGYEGAKLANPNVIVCAGYGYSMRHIYDGDFNLDSLVQKGFLNYVDALDTHTYTGNTPPEDVLPGWLSDLRTYLTSKGYPDMPLYCAEFGYSIEPGTAPGGSYTLEEQADVTVRHVNLLASDPYVKLVSYWCLHGSGGDVDLYTLIDMDTKEPRPVYYAYQNFIEEHSGS